VVKSRPGRRTFFEDRPKDIPDDAVTEIECHVSGQKKGKKIEEDLDTTFY
jgi:hypothetical protein